MVNNRHIKIVNVAIIDGQGKSREIEARWRSEKIVRFNSYVRVKNLNTGREYEGRVYLAYTIDTLYTDMADELEYEAYPISDPERDRDKGETVDYQYIEAAPQKKKQNDR